MALPSFTLKHVRQMPECLRTLEAHNNKCGWRVEGAYELPSGIVCGPELVDTLLEWVGSQDAWMDHTGTKMKMVQSNYDLIWMLAQVRGSFIRAGDVDEVIKHKLRTIGTRAVYWVNTLACYTVEEDFVAFRTASVDQVDEISPLANRLKDRWEYVCGLWKDPTFQALADFLKPFYDARVRSDRLGAKFYTNLQHSFPWAHVSASTSPPTICRKHLVTGLGPTKRSTSSGRRTGGMTFCSGCPPPSAWILKPTRMLRSIAPSRTACPL